MVVEFEQIFAIPLFILKLNRGHPETQRNLKWVVDLMLLYGQFSLVFICLVYNIFYIDMKGNNFAQACKNGIFVIIYTSVTLMYAVLILRRDLIMSLIAMIRKDLNDAKLFPKHEQEIVETHAMKQNFICKEWLFLSFYTCILFHLKVLALTVYYQAIGQPQFVHLIELTYPSYVETRKNDLWMYLIIYYFILIYGVYGASMYAAFVPLGPAFMVHAVGQMELAVARIGILYEGNPDEEVLKKRLKAIVMTLQRTYEFVNRLKICLALFYEVNLKATSIALPVTLFLLLKSFKAGVLDLEFTSFLLSGVILSSTPCYYGDTLLQKNEEVRQAVYTCGWERGFSRSTRSTIFILQTRGLQPVAVQTLFRTVCLDALIDVFRQVYSIFGLMNAVLE